MPGSKTSKELVLELGVYVSSKPFSFLETEFKKLSKGLIELLKLPGYKIGPIEFVEICQKFKLTIVSENESWAQVIRAIAIKHFFIIKNLRLIPHFSMPFLHIAFS